MPLGGPVIPERASRWRQRRATAVSEGLLLDDAQLPQWGLDAQRGDQRLTARAIWERGDLARLDAVWRIMTDAYAALLRDVREASAGHSAENGSRNVNASWVVEGSAIQAGERDWGILYVALNGEVVADGSDTLRAETGHFDTPPPKEATAVAQRVSRAVGGTMDRAWEQITKLS